MFQQRLASPRPLRRDGDLAGRVLEFVYLAGRGLMVAEGDLCEPAAEDRDMGRVVRVGVGQSRARGVVVGHARRC